MNIIEYEYVLTNLENIDKKSCFYDVDKRAYVDCNRDPITGIIHFSHILQHYVFYGKILSASSHLDFKNKIKELIFK